RSRVPPFIDVFAQSAAPPRSAAHERCSRRQSVHYVAWLAMMTVFAAAPGLQAQRRSQTGPVTFAIFVTDPAGSPIGWVAAAVDGPAMRQATTGAGHHGAHNAVAAGCS